MDEENQETRESPAVEPAPAADEAPAEEVTFSQPEEPAAPSGESPAAAQERAEFGDESPFDRPEVQILGAFVGAFVLAKLLQKLFSRD